MPDDTPDASHGISNMTDTDALIERWRAGDERAAEALYNCHWDRTFWLAYGLLGDPDDAEEVAQDALHYALVNIARYDPQRASFSTWLHTITVSRSRNRRRRKHLHLSPLTILLKKGGTVPDPSPSQEHQMIRAETRGEVWKAIQTLSPPLREAILLRYWAEHTYREMAAIMRCPVSTAQSRVRLAFQRLQVTLTQDSLTDLGYWEEENAR
jgi:RNA polymerase sigma-70 factor (ECF subfamily)